MTAQEDPYVRVYYRALTDDKFRDLSSAAWGHWVRLLVVADGLYPASAPLPRWVEDGPLEELVAARIVDREGGDYFRIHGMRSEREGRTEAATFAADVKHHGRAEAERRRAERKGAGAVQPHAGAAPTAAVQPESARGAASPILSSPNQSNPVHSPRSGNGLTKIDGTKKKPPEDEETVMRCQSILADPEAPKWKKDAARDQLRVMGVAA